MIVRRLWDLVPCWHKHVGTRFHAKHQPINMISNHY